MSLGFAVLARLARAGRPLRLALRRLRLPRILLLLVLASAVAVASCSVPPGPGERRPTASPTSPPVAPTETQVNEPTQVIILPPVIPVTGGPAIHDVRLNLEAYPAGQVPRYGKFEITFAVDTTAPNLQLPYDPAPPPGIAPSQGVSVDGLFSRDGWRTVYTQPAFYYQDFTAEVRSEKEWFYPTGGFVWKVRFAPPTPGQWEFKLAAQDVSGRSETAPQAFSVADSADPGFVRVSARDPRYFEFERGAYFPGMGYNMNHAHLSWNNPTLDNAGNIQAMSENGIQLVRIWLSQWGIFGSAWNPWNSPDPARHGLYIPHHGINAEQAYPGSEVSMKIKAPENPCMFLGLSKSAPAVKRSTDYRVRVRYKTAGLSGPKTAELPYGLVAKTGGWLWGEGKFCYDPGQGSPVTPYASVDGDWAILEGRLNSGESDFLPNFYLTLENTAAGTAYIDYVWIEEDLGNGSFGPNIIPKPWMAHHLYFEQRNSFAFDRLVELAGQYGVYLRPVVMEKNDWIFNHIDENGAFIPDDPLCKDADAQNDPARCPGNGHFYGKRDGPTKVRWLQQAWWRYLQARWGYSTRIHSWELLNEGDPASERHYNQADEFGKYMRQFAPNHHLVSTSFWHSFPVDEFWGNLSYPNVDFADIHIYLEDGDRGFSDTAQATADLSLKYGARQPEGPGKPVIRGELGFLESGGEQATSAFAADTEGIWLHNLIWGGINPGGLIESYWYEDDHIYRTASRNEAAFDHRSQYRAYYNFIKDIPLNNGNYTDAQAETGTANLRAWGQKDVRNGQAHLWIQNLGHTWAAAAARAPIQALSSTVKVSGFRPGSAYRLEWWDPYQPDPTRQLLEATALTAGPDGSLLIPVEGLARDIAVKIRPPNVIYLPNVKLTGR